MPSTFFPLFLRQKKVRQFIIALQCLCITAFYTVIFTEKVCAARTLIPITVLKVIDGDTLEILLQDGTQAKVRLYGIDAPELKQKSGVEAKKRLEVLIRDKAVYLEAKGSKDKYGRIIGVIYTSMETNFSINEAMVREGYAWVYRDYCKEFFFCSNMLLDQKNAETRRIGLWRENPPYIPPWDYRKNRNLE